MARLEHPQAVTRRTAFGTWRMDWKTVAVSAGVGLVSFLVTEGMHRLLVPDLGRLWERLLAECISALVVAILTAGLMQEANRRREAALLRMQVISEMNHHIRNALAVISLMTSSMESRDSVRVISESVDRIEWTLREILLRSRPLTEKEHKRMHFQTVGEVPRTVGGDSHGQRQNSVH